MSMVCHGQTVDSLTYRIHFTQNSSELDVERADNSSALSRFEYDLDSLRNADGISVQEIIVRGNASWEGSDISNQYICRVRARAVAGYIHSSFGVDATTTESYLTGSDVIDLVSKPGSAYTHEIISILKSSDPNEIKIQSLRGLDSGKCWKWLRASVFPELRSADIIIRYSVPDPVTIAPVIYALPVQVEEPVKPEEPVQPEESVLQVEEPVQQEVPTLTEEPEHPVLMEEQVKVAEPADTVESKSTFYLALKNNIIYDVALVANLGLEISLGKHFSLDLPFTFSPYDICSAYRMRTLSVQPELRYYFKRGGKGHFFGLHGNLAYYNVVTPLNMRTRYQDRDGEHPLYGGGISYGYSLPFGKDSRWGMEFTIGAGYAYLDYDCFYNVNNGAWFTKDTKHYFGIDKAGITIYYRIVDKNRKKK